MSQDTVSYVFYSLCFLLLLDHLLHLSVYFFDRIWQPILGLSKTKPSYHFHLTTSLAGTILFIFLGYLTYVYFGLHPIGCVLLLVFHILIIMGIMDYKYQIIPDTLNYSLITIGLIASYFNIFISLIPALIGMIAGYAIPYSINFIFKHIRKKDGMGHGDFKLLAGLGTIIGAPALLFVLTIGSLLSILQALILYIFCRNPLSAPAPFGPALASAGIIYIFYGNYLINLYFSLIL